MTLGLAVARLADHLTATMTGAPGHIGGAAPTVAGELPALVLSIRDATEIRAGIGDLPRPTQHRPLLVTSRIAIADAALHFPDGDVPLLTDSGSVLQVPHGGLVHADGKPPPPPLDGDDLQLEVDGVPLVYKAAGPLAANEFRFDQIAAFDLGYGEPEAAGVVRFGAPLAGTTITARYFVGSYELSSTRYRGQLAVDVIAASAAAVDTLSDAVAAALRPGVSATLGTAYALTPTSWGPIGLPDATLGNARRRTITFRFDLELEEVRLPTGGGTISRVEVQTFLKTHEPPPPLPKDKDFSVSAREENS